MLPEEIAENAEKKRLWRFQAKPTHIVDGDTADVVVDVGFEMRREIRLRFADVDTAEIHFVEHSSDEYKLGKEHTEYVKDWFAVAEKEHDGEWPLIVTTERKGKYGRYVAWIQRKRDNQVVNADLVREYGDSVVY